MKVIGYCALHYGKPYLDAAIRSIIDGVDQFYVLYTDIGSHGHRSSALNPDSQDELHAIAEQAAGRKLIWVSSRWEHEGHQRDYIHTIAPDAGIVIPVDYDEIWQPGLLERALQAAADNPTVRRWRIPFRHYWRSFYRCILHDPAYPHRLYNTRGDREQEATLDAHGMAVNHMGYAIPVKYQAYKWGANGNAGIHGHLSEYRRDVDWLNDVYIANRQTDCHPVGSIYWNAELIDPFARGYLPGWMKEHLYANLDVIE